MLVFQNISKSFNDNEVLKDITFRAEKGEFIILTGPSGSGKTTLMHMIIGKQKPTGGNVYIDGQPLATLASSALQFIRRNIGVVFQDYELLPYKTVAENVAFVLEVCEKPRPKIDKRVEEVLSKVGILERKDAFPQELSGGEKQRAAIARAIVHKPSLLLADEPTGNLDQENVQGIVKLLQDINRNGTTVLLTTHNRDVINHFEDHKKRFMNLEEGRVFEHVGRI
jgi:cell division transport system ATP-binding protein